MNEEGKADFQALQNFQTKREGIIVYYVFDVVWLERINLTKEPLYKRKEILRKILPDMTGQNCFLKTCVFFLLLEMQ